MTNAHSQLASPLFNKRRDLIKLTAAIGATTAASSVWGQSVPNVGQGRNVIVIGAGIAGLAAAGRLKAAGFVPIVLEARNRTGGRMWTDRTTLGFACDMGAGWIHGPDGNNPVTALARQANARTFLTSDDSVKVFDGMGMDVTTTQAGTWDARYRTQLIPALDNLARTLPADVSVMEAIRQVDASYLTNPFMIYPITAYGEFDSGGPIEELSAYYWRGDEKFPGKDVILPDGYDAIPTMLANGLDMRLGVTVTGIDTSGTGVRVTTASGTLSAPFAVCTLPLGVLKKDTVRFTPALPDLQRGAIDRVRMGYVNKVFCEFDSAFWPTDTQYFGYHAPSKGLFANWLNYRTFSNINCLVAVASGTAGRTIETLTPAELSAQLTTALRAMFGNDAPAPKRINASRWNGDPLAGGAYSFANVGVANEDFGRMAAPVADKLFFAGEHCSRPYRATVHGAYLTALSAADALIAKANVTLSPTGDEDSDGIPNGVETTEGRSPFVKDNDIFGNARLFAMQMYRDFLAREGDTGGVSFWAGALSAGTQSRASMIEAFTTSGEFDSLTAPLARLYFGTFLRIPDYAGLLFWTDEFRSGRRSLLNIAEAFTTVPEFTIRYGNIDNAGFVNLLYQNILQRTADAAGLAFWVGEINSGRITRGGMLMQFTESAEYKANRRAEIFTTLMFAGMLKRAPDQAVFDQNVTAIKGGATLQSRVQIILALPEYRSRFLPA
jgi:monoamine oxidase